MRKIQKILIGAFLGGVLLGGIGTGVAVAEYSSISYMGEKRIGEENLITKDFDFEFQPEDGEILLERNYWTERAVSMIEEDPAVPVGVIRYQVTYNPEVITPYLSLEERDVDAGDGETEDESTEHNATAQNTREQGILSLHAEYHSDSFEQWMEYKDEILAGLKRGEISSYRVLDMDGIRILVNPETKQYVK